MDMFQKALICLLKDEPCYGHLIQRMNIISDDKVKTASVHITNKINLTYSPTWFNEIGLVNAAGVLKHECEHIFKNHIPRAMEIGIDNKTMMKRLNLASDATINVHDLEAFAEENGVTLNNLNKKLQTMLAEFNAKRKPNEQKTFIPIEANQTSEYIFNRLNEFCEDNKDQLPESGEGMGETHDNHDKWGESDKSTDVIEEVTKQAVNDAVNRAGGIGNVPAHIAQAVMELNKPKVNWRQELRRFEAQSIKAASESTRMKRNRRYGILYPGKKKQFKAHLAVCVDTSGSMQGERLQLAWAELCGIHARGVKITLIEADSAVTRVSEFDPNKQIDFKGGGGTCYEPPIQYAKNLKPDGIIFLGDMDAFDTPSDPKIRFLWVTVSDNTTKPGNFGKMIQVIEEKKR